MKSSIRVQLSAMMFLNFFIWGMWFVTMGTYLSKGGINATDGQIGQAYGVQCIGAFIAPFIIGLIADRFFAAQKILGLLHFAGAALMYFISTQTAFANFYTLLLAYMIVYMPTLALANTVALKQVTNAEKQFGAIRMFGTIGWIVAGAVIKWMAWEDSPENLALTFKVTAAVSVVLGVFSFFLPDTPPAQKGKDVSMAQILGLDALKILKDKNYLLFFVASILICIPLAFYYGQANLFLNEAGMKGAAGEMVWGQVAEAAFLFLLPLFFKKFGIKQMLLFGMVAWMLRYLLFAYGNVNSGLWMLYAGILLHGICYDFFFVTGQIYTDKKAGLATRAAAQGLITLATYGVGMYIGYWLAGSITGGQAIKNEAGKIINHHWQQVWIFPCLFAAGVALLFLLLFKNDKKAAL